MTKSINDHDSVVSSTVIAITLFCYSLPTIEMGVARRRFGHYSYGGLWMYIIQLN